MKKQIYSPWAFTSDSHEKMLMNVEIYNEIKDKAKIIYNDDLKELTDEMKREKAYLIYAGTGYAHTNYRILSNPDNLSTSQLALICDGGNLCFGYRVEGNVIKIYTD